MKLIYITILFLLSINNYAQEWHLNSVDTSKEYGYEYWFRFDNLNDTSTYELKKVKNNDISTIRILDNNGEPIPVAKIELTNIKTDLFKGFISDFDGKKEFKIQPGKYRLEINALYFEKFELTFNVEETKSIELTINLGRAQELEVYQINSKVKLADEKIMQIIDCVRQNRHDYNEICKDEDYQIFIQI
jgi:uncharacterized membrane protein